jgi:predicted MFS family arabinose efflux permease
MESIASLSGARWLFAVSILARLPLAMLSIALLVHAEHLTGSFAAAGAVAGSYAAALGVGGPLLGRLADRRGQTAVLVVSAGVAAALLVALAALPNGAPPAAPLALAAGLGLATPPLGACLRTVLPGLLPDAASLRAAYAVEASAVELTWIAGPPLALALGALWSTGAVLVAAGLVLVAGTVAFAVQPASRRWRAETTATRPRGGSLRSPAMRTLVMVLTAVGLLFGAVEVAVTAAADALEGTTAAAPLLALWGVGSLAGGLVAARRSRSGRQGPGLAAILGALTLGHLALVPAAGSVLALGAVLVVAGAAIAPAYAAVYAMVDGAAPTGTVTEAFAWLATAVAIGAAAGAAIAGAVAESAGPAAALALAGAAGAAALLATAMRASTLVVAVPLATARG